MKKLIIILIALFTLIAFTSCEKHEQYYGNGELYYGPRTSSSGNGTLTTDTIPRL